MENSITKDKTKAIESITTDNIFKVFLRILLPILFVNMLNYLYEIYDTLMISVSGIGSVKDVVVLNQIKKTIATLGSGIVVGAALDMKLRQ